MASKKKLLQAAAGSAGGGAITDIDEAFSTFIYEGTGAAQNIANGINLGNNIAGSVDFDGTGDSLESTSHSFAYGTGDFTVEFWMYPHSLNSQSVVFGARADASTGFMIGPNNSGEIRFYYNNAERIVDTGNALSINTWFHIAVTRASGTTKLFKNGTQVGSSYSDTNNYTSSVLEIGQRAISDGLAYDGLVSNVRVVLGTALYTSNFTPSTEPLTAISGTELLICTANNFLDEGPNKIPFTVKGDPQVSLSSPFTGNTGEGGLVWIKNRDSANGHNLEDTERGAGKSIYSNTTDEQYNLTGTSGLSSFNSNGFSIIGSQNRTNTDGDSYVSWTFRKAPKFFDVVTWTGDGTSPRNISHSLGSQPGMIIVKRTSSAEDWTVYHRSVGATKYLTLNSTGAEATFSQVWADTSPTSTQFTVGNTARVNTSGENYVAYLFAHNNSDGEFGPDADQDIIKCGSFTTNSSGEIPDVNLGFEPQFVLMKASGANTSWFMMDTMRGYTLTGTQPLEANSSNAETTSWGANTYLGVPTSTGFTQGSSNTGTNNTEWIYMAIRRGPLAEPTSATDVFHIQSQSDGATYSVGFPIDTFLHSKVAGSSINAIVGNRLTGNDKYLITSSTAAEGTSSGVWEFDLQNSFKQGATTGQASIAWHWKRAPGFFDVVAYTGNGTAGRTVSHNLGVKPEMIWVKTRSNAVDWGVYHKDLGATKYVRLNNNFSASTNIDPWNNTEPTSSVFTVEDGTTSNSNGYTYIAYLFATVAGVSKVGSYTGSSSGVVTVDCGFSAGARLVICKRTDATGSWYIYDSVRGINSSADDPYLLLDTTDAEVTNTNNIEPHSSGFQLTQQGANPVSINGGSYIFYAIA